MAGCAADEPVDATGDPAVTSSAQAIAAIGDPLPGILAEDFALDREIFASPAFLETGLGPIFNETSCGACHSLGAVGGGGAQIERRFGRFDNGAFNSLANRGGSLRQLFSNGTFIGASGQTCTVPLEQEPPEATIHAGRMTTPTFGAGLVDAMPDAFFEGLAARQGAAIRGVVNRVRIVLPNPDDPTQNIGGTRVGRFGWKADQPNLVQFAATAYVNEMGITTTHCIRGTRIDAFATESRPNGVAVPPGCDDLADTLPGAPPGTDGGPVNCGGGLTEIEEDVAAFVAFMTFLAPPPMGPIDPGVAARGIVAFERAGCGGCHVSQAFRTPAVPANGVPGNFAFRPFSDFLLHDIGVSDMIGNDGDSAARTRLMRTAPLWGLRFRAALLHDGRTTDLNQAIHLHRNQALAAVRGFDALSAADRNAVLALLRAL